MQADGPHRSLDRCGLEAPNLKVAWFSVWLRTLQQILKPVIARYCPAACPPVSVTRRAFCELQVKEVDSGNALDRCQPVQVQFSSKLHAKKGQGSLLWRKSRAPQPHLQLPHTRAPKPNFPSFS